MRSPTSARCATSASARQLLDALAPALLEHDHDVLVHVVRHRRTVDLGVRPLGPGEAAIDALIGATAPHEWHAIGFVTGGTARPLPAPDDDEDAIGSPLKGRSGRVRLAVLADRSGDIASVVGALDDGLEPDVIDTTACERPTGWVVDVCQRVLGMPTEPASTGVGAWLDVVWLDALVAAVSAAPARPWSWPDLAALHPLQPDGPAPSPRALAADARRAVAETSWSRLRASVAAGDAAGPGPAAPGAVITSEMAGWLDDGAFARYLIGRYPSVEALLGVLGQLLPTRALGSVRAALVEPP